jgi:hypothetical protein
MLNWLLRTAIVEIVNIGLFSYVWWIMNRILPGKVDILSVLGLFTLNVFLLQGGLYWLLARTRFFHKTPAQSRFFFLRGLYWFNIFLILVFPSGAVICALIGNATELPDFLLGAAFYLFGVIEFLHYFVFKINMRRYEREYWRRTHRFVPARLLRELHRAQKKYHQDYGLNSTNRR